MKICSKCGIQKELNEFYPRTVLGKYTARCKKCCIKAGIAWRNASPFKGKKYIIKYKYGLSWDEYQEMFFQQDNKCAICKTELKPEQKKVSIDHCHKTGKVRGLLCNECNHGLGNFQDNPELLLVAINYLKGRT